MDAVRVAMIIVMVILALGVHQRMRLFFLVGHHHGNVSMGQRLPAHAEHQDEGREAAPHALQFTGGGEGKPLTARHSCR